MVKKILSTVLIIFSILIAAQNFNFKAPNYKEIERNIQDKNSEFYYPNLLSKLKLSDTLITSEQYKHLYYGYIFQKEYNPYGNGKNDEKLIKYFKGDFKKDEIADVIETLKIELNESPMNLRVMNFLAYMYHENGNEEMAVKTAKNLQGLFNAILTSGNGEKCETAFHVIKVSDEYFFLNMLQLEVGSQSFDGVCDYLAFEKHKYKVPGIYFNVEKMLEKIQKN